MKEVHLFYAPGLPECAELPAEEAAHAVRVLRMKAGEALLATDGRGSFYECTLQSASPKSCSLHIDRTIPGEKYWHGEIHLAVAPTKNMDRMEWLAEKATEIGMDGIHFLLCHNSERRVLKTERVEKIVVAATKQSHKAYKPTVAELTPFAAFLQQPGTGAKFIAHCLAAEGELPFLFDLLPAHGDATVLIGPEGDFTPEEVERAQAAGYQPVSLGRSRLRTETAALVAVQLMNLKARIS